MSIPGSNLLRRAARLIKLQPVDYYQDAGRVNNAIGLDVTNYLPAVSIQGSVQAVPLNNYQQLGLDLGRNYVNLYTSTPLIGVKRDVSGDVFVFNEKVYQCQSTTDWIGMDGWNSVLAVETSIGAPTLITYVVTPQPDLIIEP